MPSLPWEVFCSMVRWEISKVIVRVARTLNKDVTYRNTYAPLVIALCHGVYDDLRYQLHIIYYENNEYLGMSKAEKDVRRING